VSRSGPDPEQIEVAHDDRIGVAGPDDGVAGYIDRSRFERLDPMYLDTGTRRIAAYEVRDADGTLVGYMVSTLGYIEKETARSGPKLDALLLAEEENLDRALDDMLAGTDKERCRALLIRDELDGSDCPTP